MYPLHLGIPHSCSTAALGAQVGCGPGGTGCSPAPQLARPAGEQSCGCWYSGSAPPCSSARSFGVQSLVALGSLLALGRMGIQLLLPYCLPTSPQGKGPLLTSYPEASYTCFSVSLQLHTTWSKLQLLQGLPHSHNYLHKSLES